MTCEISYDLVMQDDMSFVEGSFRVKGGDWQVFVITRKKSTLSEPKWRPSTWDSGVTGLVFEVPSQLRLNKKLVNQLFAIALGICELSEVRGPDSMQLR